MKTPTGQNEIVSGHSYTSTWYHLHTYEAVKSGAALSFAGGVLRGHNGE